VLREKEILERVILEIDRKRTKEKSNKKSERETDKGREREKREKTYFN
jgi:hypothetical protein